MRAPHQPPSKRPRVRRGAVVVAASLGVLAQGCFEFDNPCGLGVCDPRDADCVVAVAETVACQRDSEVFVPEVRFATSEEIFAEFEPTSAEELARAKHYYAGEALVGLMPAGYDPTDERADSLAQAVALYQSGSGTIVILTDREPSDPKQAYSTLLHEMVHAYQDAEYDLEALWYRQATSFDRSLGYRAAIEGEAEFRQMHADAQVRGFALGEIDWPATFGNFQSAMLEEAEETDQPSLTARSFFPYAFGGEMMHRAAEAGDQPRVREIALNPPDSVRHVMLGYEAGEPGDFNRDAELSPRAVPVVPGHAYLGGSAQGAWLINAMLQRTAGSDARWHVALAETAADELSVFMNADTGEHIAVWRIVEDAPALRSALDGPGSRWSAIAEPAGTYSVFEVDGDVVLVATEHTQARAVFERVAAWESVDAALQRAGVDSGPRRMPPMMR